MTATTLFDIDPLRPLVAAGHLLLTPNRRLASRIRAALVVAGRIGAAAMPMPRVQALSDWLETQWQQLVFHGELGADVWVLNAEQERVLWERVIRASPVGDALLRPGQAAELAAGALRTLALWRQWPLSAASRAYFTDTDPQCFLDWVAKFEAVCREQGCITVAERDARTVAALTAIHRNRSAQSQPLALVCFDELPPLYAALAESLGAPQIAIESRNRTAIAVACDSYEQQIRAGVRWISRQLAEQGRGPYALVVPDLTAQRARVERILRDELMPQHTLPGASRQLLPVNFSAGEPLADAPIVQTALRVLALLDHDIDRADVLALLQSPFIERGDDESAAHAIVDVCALLTETLSGAQLRAACAASAERRGGWPFERALQKLADFVRQAKLANLRAPLSTWAEHFRQALALLGWPGPRSLDSVEFQQVALWQQMLAELAAFDEIAGQLSLGGALSTLRQLAAGRVFQAQTPDAPIQVLGVLEAAGLQFEGLWLCDMGDDQWPPSAAPHPLLPRDWQRRLRMPHCDAEREFQVAAQLSASLQMNTREFVVSYQRERDEVARHVSPLFDGLPKMDLAALGIIAVEPFKPAVAATTAPLQYFDAGAAPRLDAFVRSGDGSGVRARGGSALLADQAACPFRAFARHRLRAEPLDEPLTGLSAAERGTLLHAALQSLWQTLQNSAALRACDEEALIRYTTGAAQFALTQLPTLDRFGPRFLALESARLARVLMRWLMLELDRADVEIAALEEEQRFQFAGLDLRLRVDRIDRLADGRVAIVDYKSGQGNSANAWLGERTEQPQLPLYALALEHAQPGSVAGVAFAQVRLDNARWVGLGDTGLEAYELKPASDVADWSAQLQAWRNALQSLANEFIEGRADVAPLAPPKTCQFCSLTSVCRIDHAQLDAEAEA